MARPVKFSATPKSEKDSRKRLGVIAARMMPPLLRGHDPAAAVVVTAEEFQKGVEAVTANAFGPPMPVPTVESLLATMRQLAPPEPEQVVVTPSLDALREVVPFELDPTGRRTLDGVRVVVSKFADRPRLIPAACLDRTGFGLPVDLIGQSDGANYAAAKTALGHFAGPGWNKDDIQADTPTVVEGGK